MASKWQEQQVEAGGKMNRRLRRALRKVPEGTPVLIRAEEKIATVALSNHPDGSSLVNPAAGKR